MLSCNLNYSRNLMFLFLFGNSTKYHFTQNGESAKYRLGLVIFDIWVLTLEVYISDVVIEVTKASVKHLVQEGTIWDIYMSSLTN